MAKFTYQAKNVTGRLQYGQVEAMDEIEARSKLVSANLKPVRVTSIGGGSGSQRLAVSTKELQIFTRQFSTLINAGIPIVDCLKILGEGKRNIKIKEAVNYTRESIEAGKRLGDAMAQRPQIFDRFYVNMVRAGEEAGILDDILNRLAVYMEKAEKIRKLVTGAMIYPIVILIVATLVVVGILIFVIPKFQEMYAGSGQQLPALTQAVVGLSSFVQHQWYLVLAVIVGVPYSLLFWYNTPEGRRSCDALFISAPLFGDLVQKSSVAKMTRTLSTLLSSGVSVITALEIAARTAGNSVIENALLRSKEAVTMGKPLAVPISKEKRIPDMVAQMITVGEQSGTLDIMLGKIADFYEDDVESTVKALTTLIEPLMMLFLGVIIALLLGAMYLPIFNMSNIIK